MEEVGPPTWLIGRAAETAYRLSDSGDPITPKDVAECMPLTVGEADWLTAGRLRWPPPSRWA